MVDKKLNFNQPILSVRRYSPKMASQMVDERKGNSIAIPTTHWLPPHKSEPNSGPVRNPGAVPFQWEQSPGRPKEGILARADQPPFHQVASTTSGSEMEDCSEAVVDKVDLGVDASNPMNQVNLPESASTTSEMSEYAAAKRQQEEKRGKVVNQDKPVLVHCRPTFENSFFHHNKKKECGDDQDQTENVITVCCLLPRSSLKTSVCNLNPVPVTSLMNRVMTFPATRVMSRSSLSSSSTDSENEHALKLKETEAFTKHGPCKKSFKTLQELLADEGGTVKNVERDNEFGDDSESNVRTSDEMNVIEDSSSQEEEEDIQIRIAVNKAAKNAKKQLSRARTLGNAHNFGVVPPPLPESPSDSWLFRTLPAVSAKKATSSDFICRFSNK